MPHSSPSRPTPARTQVQSYAALLGIARAFVRRKSEAEDLLQGALLIAVESGRSDFAVPKNRRWLCGVLKNLAAFDARGACRRRARDTAWNDAGELFVSDATPFQGDEIRAFARQLPPRLRTAALLAIAGHTRAEIGWLLRVSDMAVRQYVTEIRKRWRSAGGRAEGDMLLLTGPLAFGRIRQGLRAHVAGRVGVVLASHDPDGYGFSVSLSSQNRP